MTTTLEIDSKMLVLCILNINLIANYSSMWLSRRPSHLSWLADTVIRPEPIDLGYLAGLSLTGYHI